MTLPALPTFNAVRLLLSAGLVWGALLLGACVGGGLAAPTDPTDPRDPDGLYRLGLQYGMGDPAQGIAPDAGRSRHYLEQAAARDYLPALHALAWIDYEGRGGSRDLPRAIGLFSQAAAGGYAESQFMLGLIYSKGEGVERNNTVALQWINRAADQGHPEARKLLEGLFKAQAAPPRPE